ncbi:Gti1/Pac2 family-domain-containing protein, partial [Mycena olivaceomarginata]
MKHPTCTGICIRSKDDAHVMFHAVRLGKLPMITRRLDTEERRAVSSGCVFVWEEKAPDTLMGLGLTRWTDSLHWGPSRVRDEFLVYGQINDERCLVLCAISSGGDFSMPFHRKNLIKQTYSAIVETAAGLRKWHV